MKSYDAPMPFLEISERYSPLMDAPGQLMDGTYVSTLTLADRAFQHPYFGQQLRKQPPRFSFYFDNNERTVEYLGTDADTVGHMYELSFHAASIIESERIELSDQDRGALMLALFVHDMDETTHEQVRYTCGHVVGDIQCNKKTSEDKFAQEKIRQMLYREVFYDVPVSMQRRIESIIAHKDTTILGELFEISHELQTYETSTRAGATLESGDYSKEHQLGLEALRVQTHTHAVKKITPYLGKHASIDNLLEYMA